ncbi:MAG TPA: ABC transporter substrate-binding protein [Nocardioidaceae bacterium]|nr:ABC transporter substrate-binding protein [Nocardioidaceae bacterium]
MNRRPTNPLLVANQSLITRRNMLRGLAVGGSLAAFPGLVACGDRGDNDDSSGGGNATSLGSNYSDEVPKKGLAATLAAFTEAQGIDVDVNTVDHEQFQEQITKYLQAGPDDVWSWFAGFRMRYFAAKGFAGDLSGLWGDQLDGQFSDAFKQASTGDDGNQYFVPFYNYPWAVFYRKSLFEEKGYEIPTTLDDFEALCKEMQTDGLQPLAFADQEGWPAMGTFDAINFRQNGYDFHVALMAGEESWESDEVKGVFDTWSTRIMPYQTPATDALGLDWLDVAADLVNKKAGMYYLGMFVGQAFTNEQDREDLDFFPFPEISPEYGQDTIDAPIDGFMMAPDPDDEAAAMELLTWFGSAEGQEAYLEVDPNNVATNTDADTSNYNNLQKKAVELMGSVDHITQFLDRDTDPTFASTVMISSIQDFLKSPDDIDGICTSIEEQAKSIFSS